MTAAATGNLATWLAERFEAELPLGWAAEREAEVLSKVAGCRLGFRPRVDLMLHAPSGRQVAVELEISRTASRAVEGNLVLVVWTERQDDVVRVISARWATPRERRLYRHQMEQRR